MSYPFLKVNIYPNYFNGFTFIWHLSASFSDPQPWEFTVERSFSPNGPWETISPTIASMAWVDKNPVIVSKHNILYFRIGLSAGGKEYFSPVISPYGDLERFEFLLARDILRRELLCAHKLAGIRGAILLHNTFGTICSNCRDPITGMIRDTGCNICYGVGRVPPYSGPFETYWTRSTTQNVTVMAEDGTGVRQPKGYEIRVIGSMPIKTNDVLIDLSADKRYYVSHSQNVAEIRGVPLIQMVTVNEAPVTDIIYKVTV